MDEVTPNEISRTLNVSALTFRNWLRAEKAAGHPLLAGHEYRSHYRFTRSEADRLIAEYQASDGRARAPGRPPRGAGTVPPTHPPPNAVRTVDHRRKRWPTRAPGTNESGDPFGGLALSDDPGHRITETWMDQQVVTLADLLRPGLGAVVVGINPSPVSVAAGHYYQGSLGQRFYKRLDQAGVIDLSAAGFEDDAAFAAGIGFTDVVKRPTARAGGLRPGELKHGRELLEAKLDDLQVPKILFTFKASAETLLGPLDKPGRQAERTLAGADIFVMPGPMARTELVERALRTLRTWWDS